MSEIEDAFCRDAFGLIDAFEDLADPLVMQERIHAFVARCGFEWFTITRLPQPGERLAPNVLLSVWPRGWLTHYDRAGHYKFDPAVRHCYRTIEPFRWSDVLYEPATAQRARRVMDEAAELGMREGYCIPIHDAVGFQAAISLAGREVALTPKVRLALHLLGLYAWGAADRVCERPRRRTIRLLSTRERDVLAWAATGRTNDEIADRLGIGEATVVTHLKSARIKTGTRNTTHAVVEALRRRELNL